jgi:membrane protease YdiL (CAAX protease family)
MTTTQTNEDSKLTLSIGGIGMAVLGALVFFGVEYLADLFWTSFYPGIFHISISRFVTISNSYYFEFAFAATAYVVSFLVLYSWFLKNKANRTALGYNKPKTRFILKIIGFYILSVGATALLTSTFSIISNGFKESTYLQQQLGLQSLHGVPTIILAFLAVSVIDPIVEETVFRGVIFSGLKQRFKPVPAAVLTSVVFALPHIAENTSGLLWSVGLGTFILSLVLCWLRQKTKSLYPGMILHGLNNAISLILVLTVIKS